jgi:hypothetical protein
MPPSGPENQMHLCAFILTVQLFFAHPGTDAAFYVLPVTVPAF